MRIRKKLDFAKVFLILFIKFVYPLFFDIISKIVTKFILLYIIY
jgi:hypothetical protein